MTNFLHSFVIYYWSSKIIN